MHTIPTQAVFSHWVKLAALAAVLPVLCGFDHQAPDQGLAIATSAAPGFDQQRPSPQPTESGQDGGAFNWRRDKRSESDRIALADPQPAATRDRLVPGNVHSWETGAGKSYLIPALEIPAFLITLNVHDRIAFSNKRSESGKKEYESTFSTTWEHLRRQNWAYDKDPFNVNQFGHPYQGATMYGLARSSGLGFWESWGYSTVGSFLWEMAGETGRPSINDQITTPNSGSLLGEALFRMSALVLRQNGGNPDIWHELGAAVLSPTTAFNRVAFDNRFKTVFPSRDPATFWRVRLGASLSGSSHQAATADFAMSYGLPGKPGYTYTRPLDYFDFQIAGLSTVGNPISNVLLRGLLYGKPYQVGDDYRGIWGIYGSYDYISPTIFRVSTTALSLGSTGQYWVAPGVALQGSLLGGAGFGGAGVTPLADGERDYHYGFTPHGLLALRVLFGTRAALEVVGRGYYVSGTGSDFAEGSETIFRINSNVTYRVYGRHGVGLQLVESLRDARYVNHPKRHQSDRTISLVYTFFGDAHLGAVEWRNLGDR